MKWGLALKSGAVAGAVYGVLAGIVGLAYMVAMKEEVIARMQAAIPQGVSIPMSMEDLYNISLAASVPSSMIMGVIVGMVFGIVFMLMKDELLGKNLRFRGMFLSVFLFAALGIWEIFYPENLIGGLLMLRFSPWPLIPCSFAAFLVLGYLQGMFWERFEKKK
jgi:vacuolar-type H+-ATPase subunit I/STV1